MRWIHQKKLIELLYARPQVKFVEWTLQESEVSPSEELTDLFFGIEGTIDMDWLRNMHLAIEEYSDYGHWVLMGNKEQGASLKQSKAEDTREQTAQGYLLREGL